MEKNQNSVDGCLEKLKKLESEYKQALQNLDMNSLSSLRLQIKQQNEKLRTVRRIDASHN
jgi:hypothetical protein